MSAPDCTCLILFTNGETSIDYCPKHDAVDQMYEALNDLTVFFDSGNHIAVFAAQIQAGSEWVKAARDALAAARGETERVR